MSRVEVLYLAQTYFVQLWAKKRIKIINSEKWRDDTANLLITLTVFRDDYDCDEMCWKQSSEEFNSTVQLKDKG
jgi:hypothetical protein